MSYRRTLPSGIGRAGVPQLLIAPSVLAALLLIPLAAHAQTAAPEEPGIYLGGGIGYNRVESEDFPNDDDDLDDEHVSYKGIAGIRLNRVLSIEGQYIDFGDSEDDESRVEADGWTAGAVLTLPMWEAINPYAKAGALFWNAEGYTPSGGIFDPAINADDDGTDFTYGLGVRFNLTPMLALRTEYERFELNDIDIDMGSANLVFSF